MKLNQLVLEKHYTGPLYHTTQHDQAAGILSARHFYLKDIVSDLSSIKIDENPMYSKLHKAGYHYYLSVARSKINDFSKLAKYKITFILSGSYFINNSKYKVLPIDYFDGHKWVQYDNPHTKRKKESEERIWSKEDRIPIDCVHEIHMCSATDIDTETAYEKFLNDALESGDYAITDYDNEFTDEEIRDMEIEEIQNDFYYTSNEQIIGDAKNAGIPLYFYEDDFDAYKILNKKRAIRYT